MQPEEFWITAEGKELLARTQALAQENGFDAAATALRAGKKLADARPEMLRRAIEIIFTRRQAEFMGAWAKNGLFTRESIEQSTNPLVAARHARHFLGCKHVLELGTGAGIDTAALANVCARVTSVESRESVAAMARHNLNSQGVSNVEILVGSADTITASLDLKKFDALWSDPARRDGGGNRIYQPEDWSPPLSFVLSLDVRGPRGIKISPGTNLIPIPEHFTREWIGLRDECIEQTLWSGTSCIDGTVFLADTAYEWIPKPSQTLEAEILDLRTLSSHWLVEPHAALIRSGHLGSFYRERGIKVLDPHIAYGAAESMPEEHLLYERFKILDSFPFTVAAVNEKLAARRWNTRSEIKKRGVSESAEELRAKLKLLPPKTEDSSFGVVFFTRIGNDHFTILAERLT